MRYGYGPPWLLYCVAENGGESHTKFTNVSCLIQRKSTLEHRAWQWWCGLAGNRNDYRLGCSWNFNDFNVSKNDTTFQKLSHRLSIRSIINELLKAYMTLGWPLHGTLIRPDIWTYSVFFTDPHSWPFHKLVIFRYQPNGFFEQPKCESKSLCLWGVVTFSLQLTSGLWSMM